MVWKVGCLTMVLGIVLSVSSCLFFGQAIDQMTDMRQVANLDLEAGIPQQAGPVSAEPGTRAGVRVEAELRLSDASLEDVGDGGRIHQTSVPVNYEVRDAQGRSIHVEAGNLAGSTIIPAHDSPHRGSYDPVVRLTFDGQGFPVPDDGAFTVDIEVGADDGKGGLVTAPRLIASDRLPESAGQWAAGGFASLVAGPLIVGAGGLVFIVGLVVASGRKRRSREPAAI